MIEETSDQSNEQNHVENDTNTRNEMSRDSLDDLSDVSQYLKKKENWESCHMPPVIFGTPKREAVRQTVKPVLIKKEDLHDPSSDIGTPNTVMCY